MPPWPGRSCARLLNTLLICQLALGPLFGPGPTAVRPEPVEGRTDSASLRVENAERAPLRRALDRSLTGLEEPGEASTRWLDTFYQSLPPRPALVALEAPPGAPFEIVARNVRTYSLDRRALGMMVLGLHGSGIVTPTTATYSTKPARPVTTSEDLVAYARALVEFAEWAAAKHEMGPTAPLAVVIQDSTTPQLRALLRDLTKAYVQGLTAEPGRDHAYRQVAIETVAGQRIAVLATYLNRLYRGVRPGRREPSPLLQTMVVDEQGHLFFVRSEFGSFDLMTASDPKWYELASLLGKDLTNVAETRFPDHRELMGPVTGALARLRQSPAGRSSWPFQRAVSDYRPEDLLIADPRKARAARLVWSLWVGTHDLHLYNSPTVGHAPMQFDFDSLLEPYDPVWRINTDSVTSALVLNTLMFQNGDMDADHRLDAYDLPAVADTIHRILAFTSLETIVRHVGYPSYMHIGDIASVEDTYAFLNDKRAHDGAWLWQATASALRKLTGVELTADQLRRLAASPDHDTAPVPSRTGLEEPAPTMSPISLVPATRGTGILQSALRVVLGVARRVGIRAAEPRLTFLDIGTGSGGLARALARQHPRAHIIALDPVQRLDSTLPGNATVVPARIEQWKAPRLAGRVDQIFWFFPESLGPGESWGAVAAKLATLLKPGGRLTMITEDGDPQPAFLADFERGLRASGLQVKTLPRVPFLKLPDHEPLVRHSGLYALAAVYSRTWRSSSCVILRAAKPAAPTPRAVSPASLPREWPALAGWLSEFIEHSRYHEYFKAVEAIGQSRFGSDGASETGLRGYQPNPAGYARVLSALLAHAPPHVGQRLLEIGPGSGAFLAVLEALGSRPDGLEPNKELAVLARQQGLRVVQGDLLAPPEAMVRDPYDVTISDRVLDVLHKFVRAGGPDTRFALGRQAVQQLARLTKPGGLSIHEVEYPFLFTEADLRDAGFEILQGSLADRFLVLRRRPTARPAGLEEPVGAGVLEAPPSAGWFALAEAIRQPVQRAQQWFESGQALSRPDQVNRVLGEAYWAQLQFLKALGLLRQVVYPATGADLLAAAAADEVFSVDPNAVMERHRAAYGDLLKRIGPLPGFPALEHVVARLHAAPWRLDDRRAQAALRAYVQTARAAGPVTVVLKGFSRYAGGPSFEQFLEPVLRDGDLAVLFGEPQLAAHLLQRGWRFHETFRSLPPGIGEIVEQTNQQLATMRTTYRYRPAVAAAGLSMHLAAPFVVLEKRALTGLEEPRPPVLDAWTQERIARLAAQIARHGTQAQMSFRRNGHHGRVSASPAATPMLRAYDVQLRLLRRLGVMRRLVYAAFGGDYLPGGVAETVLGIQPVSPEETRRDFHQHWWRDVRPRLGGARRDLERAQGRFEFVDADLHTTRAAHAITRFVREAHDDGIPAAVLLKGFQWVPRHHAAFARRIHPFLAVGDFVVVFGREAALKRQLVRLGYADYTTRLPVLARRAVARANRVFENSSDMYSWFINQTGRFVYWGEPFAIYQKMPRGRRAAAGLEEPGEITIQSVEMTESPQAIDDMIAINAQAGDSARPFSQDLETARDEVGALEGTVFLASHAPEGKVGYLWLLPHARSAHLYSIAVNTAWQRRGVANRLFETAIRFAQSNAIPQMTLTTMADNIAMIRLVDRAIAGKQARLQGATLQANGRTFSRHAASSVHVWLRGLRPALRSLEWSPSDGVMNLTLSLPAPSPQMRREALQRLKAPRWENSVPMERLAEGLGYLGELLPYLPVDVRKTWVRNKDGKLVAWDFNDWIAAHRLADLLGSFSTELTLFNREKTLPVQRQASVERLLVATEAFDLMVHVLSDAAKGEFRSHADLLSTYRGTPRDPVPYAATGFYLANAMFGTDKAGHARFALFQDVIQRMEGAWSKTKSALEMLTSSPQFPPADASGPSGLEEEARAALAAQLYAFHHALEKAGWSRSRVPIPEGVWYRQSQYLDEPFPARPPEIPQAIRSPLLGERLIVPLWEFSAVALPFRPAASDVCMASANHNYCTVCVARGITADGAPWGIEWHIVPVVEKSSEIRAAPSVEAAWIRRTVRAFLARVSSDRRPLRSVQLVLSPRESVAEHLDPRQMRHDLQDLGVLSVTVAPRADGVLASSVMNASGVGLWFHDRILLREGRLPEPAAMTADHERFLTWSWAELSTGTRPTVSLFLEEQQSADRALGTGT